MIVARARRPGSKDLLSHERLYWLRFKADYFFRKVAGFLSDRSNAPTFHARRERNTASDLKNDLVACTWIRRLIGELVEDCEHARLHSRKAVLVDSKANECWDQLLRNWRRRGLTHTLRTEGFRVRGLLPIVERLVDSIASRTLVPGGHQSILCQLPAVFRHLLREAKTGYQRNYAPLGSTTLRVPAAVLRVYLDELPTVFRHYMRESGIDMNQRGRPGKLPLAPEPASTQADAPRSLRPYRLELLKIYDMMKGTHPTFPT